MNLIKRLTIGVLATSLSISVNAAFLSVGGAGGFTLAKDTNGNDIVPVDVGLSSKISWGSNANNGTSYLELLDKPTQDIDLLGTNYLLSTLTHHNEPIDGATLVNSIISGVLELTGDFTPNPVDDVVQINTEFNIDFAETVNGSCDAAAKDNGETSSTDPNQHVHLSACDDRFDYTVNGGSFPVIIPIAISGFAYEITIFSAVDNLGNISLTSNRFWTQENADTSVYTFLRLDRAVSVPEPTSLAILGLGLLGLAASRKRKV